MQYSDVAWASWRLRSLATRWFVQQQVQAKQRRQRQSFILFLWWESTGVWWICRKNDQESVSMNDYYGWPTLPQIFVRDHYTYGQVKIRCVQFINIGYRISDEKLHATDEKLCASDETSHALDEKLHVSNPGLCQKWPTIDIVMDSITEFTYVDLGESSIFAIVAKWSLCTAARRTLIASKRHSLIWKHKWPIEIYIQQYHRCPFARHPKTWKTVKGIFACNGCDRDENENPLRLHCSENKMADEIL